MRAKHSFLFNNNIIYSKNLCSLTLPNGALDWSAVCGCIIVDHNHLLH